MKELCATCVAKELRNCQLEKGRGFMERMANEALKLFKESRPPGVSAQEDQATQEILKIRRISFEEFSREAERRGCTWLQQNLPFVE